MTTADADSRFDFDHPAWRTGLGALAGYALLLAAMTVAFFGVPYLLFRAFA